MWWIELKQGSKEYYPWYWCFSCWVVLWWWPRVSLRCVPPTIKHSLTVKGLGILWSTTWTEEAVKGKRSAERVIESQSLVFSRPVLVKDNSSTKPSSWSLFGRYFPCSWCFWYWVLVLNAYAQPMPAKCNTGSWPRSTQSAKETEGFSQNQHILLKGRKRRRPPPLPIRWKKNYSIWQPYLTARPLRPL